jgi:deoxyadenosine/deoxycytidine kinase
MASFNNNIIVSVEGNIGSGKSTLVDKLKSTYFNKDKINTIYSVENIIFLQEPVDEWEDIKNEENKTMLELFYQDQKKYAFSFQMMAYISRLSLLKKACEENKNSIIVTERSLFTDRDVFAKMLFDEKKISLENYTIYRKWFDTFTNMFNVSYIIYIDTSPNVCFERIEKRNRNGESSIELNYLNQLHQYHTKMLETFENSNQIKVNTLSGNENVFVNGIFTLWLQNINELFLLIGKQINSSQKSKKHGEFQSINN